jgi:hypothetical protein
MLKPLTFYQFATLLFIFAKLQNQIAGLSFWFVLIPISLEIIHTVFLYFAVANGWKTNYVLKALAFVLASINDYKMTRIRKRMENEDRNTL